MAYGRPPPDIDGMISLKVDNLTYRTTVEDLRHAFEKFGDVGDIYIPRDPYSHESRGFAFVRFFDKRDADDCIQSMDGKLFDGREIRVQIAKHSRPEPGRGGGRYGGGGGGGYGYGGGRSYGYGRRRYRSYSRSRSRSPRRRRRSRTPYSRSRSRSRSPARGRSRSPKRSFRSRSRSYSRSRSRS